MGILLAIIGIILQFILLVARVAWFTTKTTAKVTYKTGKVITKPVFNKVNSELDQFDTYRIGRKGAEAVGKVGKFALKTAIRVGKTIRLGVRLIFFVLRLFIILILVLSVVVSMLEMIFFMVAPAAAAGGLAVIVSSELSHSSSGVSTKTHNQAKSKKKKSSNTSGNGSLAKPLKEMSEWYLSNVQTYCHGTAHGYCSISLGRQYYPCPLLEGVKSSVGDDCSSFGNAFMSYVCGENVGDGNSLTFTQGDVQKGGWVMHLCSELKSLDELQTGDVLACNSPSGSGHHVEVYVDSGHTFGWGCNRYGDTYPLDKPCTFDGTYVRDSGHAYYCYYRYEGQ